MIGLLIEAVLLRLWNFRDLRSCLTFLHSHASDGVSIADPLQPYNRLSLARVDGGMTAARARRHRRLLRPISFFTARGRMNSC
jgi:hypothetical protein